MGTKQVEARKRARAVKAKVDARRAERDRDITRVQTKYFVAAAERTQAEEAIDVADRDMAAAVKELSDLDVRLEEIAELCEIETSEARAMKKRSTNRSETKTSRSTDAQDGQASDGSGE